MENETLALEEALAKHKPATDFSHVLQHLGTKPSSLVDTKKATIIAELVRNHPNSFSSDAPPTLEQMPCYDASDDMNSDFEVEGV